MWLLSTATRGKTRRSRGTPRRSATSTEVREERRRLVDVPLGGVQLRVGRRERRRGRELVGGDPLAVPRRGVGRGHRREAGPQLVEAAALDDGAVGRRGPQGVLGQRVLADGPGELALELDGWDHVGRGPEHLVRLDAVLLRLGRRNAGDGRPERPVLRLAAADEDDVGGAGRDGGRRTGEERLLEDADLGPHRAGRRGGAQEPSRVPVAPRALGDEHELDAVDEARRRRRPRRHARPPP